MDKSLSSADASRVLGVTPASIRLMVRRGELPVAAMTEGGIHLFKHSAVERLAKRRNSQRTVKGARADGDPA